MANWVATPKDLGFGAYYNGTPRCLNPYPPNTAESVGWLEGWDLAEQRDRK